MKCKKALIWSCITGEMHPSLNEKERTIEGVMPLVEALFPGVNYYSITGFGQVMTACVVPALKKLFPELQSVTVEGIRGEEEVEVTGLLPSDGYEWQESLEWQIKFEALLAGV